MALAVKTMPETTAEPSTSGLFVPSVVGAAYVVFALAVVFAGVPYIWSNFIDPKIHATVGAFVAGAGFIIAELVAIAALVLLGRSWMGQAAPGLRAGIFTIVAGLFLTCLIVSKIGQAFPTTLGDAIAVAIGVSIVFVASRLIAARGFDEVMRSFEHQGWFTAAAYKPNQGKKVRRATLLGFLIIAGCGVFTLLQHQTLGAAGKNLAMRVPFADRPLLDGAGKQTYESVLDDKGRTIYRDSSGKALSYDQQGKLVGSDGKAVPLTAEGKPTAEPVLRAALQPTLLTILPDVRMTFPFLLAAASIWLSYRLVNVPVFSEFLIATEGELNKVAWPTRRSLIQDTIVVLTTVVLMTVFLFVVDVAWGKILSHPYVGVLRFDASKAPAKTDQTQERDW